jgi:Lrp/AsnC family leucine-responsive transcriptional regulator
MRIQKESVRSLDKLDRKILQILQADGRISMKDLSEQVGLSITPAIERVKRMERDGVITGYHARIDPPSLGAKLLVFVEITLNQKSGPVFEQFRREVLRIPEVQECHLVSGDFDYLIKARIHEMAEYRKLLGDMLLSLPGAAQSKSYVVMEEIKETLILSTEVVQGAAGGGQWSNIREAAMISFDTLDYAKRLESGGVPPAQAAAHASALASILVPHAVSQTDLAAFEERLKVFVQDQIAALRVEITEQKAEILKWVFASAIGQTTLILLAIRYIPH